MILIAGAAIAPAFVNLDGGVLTMNTATKIDLEDLQSVMEALQKRYAKLDLKTKVDVAARLRAAVKTAEVIEAAVKDDIRAQLKGKPGSVSGEIFKANMAMIQCTRLNQSLLKEEWPDLYKQYEDTKEHQRITFEPR